MPKLLALFKIADDRNLRTSFVLTFLSSKRREPSIGWKNIAFPWYGSAPAVFVFFFLMILFDTTSRIVGG